jgi:demethylmenaquinone methyltransferase/2-methoxy-6-polyprenyl-1,4-benzoquinol methylase
MTELPDPRPGPDKQAELVQAMFDRVAPRYDVANSLLSMGQDRHWRRVAANAAAVGPGDVALDVAAGTGGLSRELEACGAQVLALDFSWNMLRAGADRAEPAERVWWVNADGTRLPLPDASADAVTIGFGLRNLPDPVAGLAEFARVAKPGARLVVLEFSQPVWRPFREVYTRYLVGALPRIAHVVTSDPQAYRYLAESIQQWPDQEALAGVIREAGWREVRWKNLSGGIVAVHRAVRA